MVRTIRIEEKTTYITLKLKSECVMVYYIFFINFSIQVAHLRSILHAPTNGSATVESSTNTERKKVRL